MDSCHFQRWAVHGILSFLILCYRYFLNSKVTAKKLPIPALILSTFSLNNNNNQTPPTLLASSIQVLLAPRRDAAAGHSGQTGLPSLLPLPPPPLPPPPLPPPLPPSARQSCSWRTEGLGRHTTRATTTTTTKRGDGDERPGAGTVAHLRPGEDRHHGASRLQVPFTGRCQSKCRGNVPPQAGEPAALIVDAQGDNTR